VEATHTLDQAARRLAATLKRLWEEG